MKLFTAVVIFIFSFYSFSELKLPEKSFEDSGRLKDRLALLSPQSNVIIIQRRYLPRTGRFELSPSFMFFLSSEFMMNVGVGGSFGFNILEKHGFEFRGAYSVVLPRRAIRDLSDILNFSVRHAPYDKTEAFFGLVYKWFPVYGKMALWDRKIIPFETYLTLGGGLSRVICSKNSIIRSEDLPVNAFLSNCLSSGGGRLTAEGGGPSSIARKWELTSILGIGQSYAVSRNTSFRMDITHQYYGHPIDNPNSDIAVSFALSIFFPGRS